MVRFLIKLLLLENIFKSYLGKYNALDFYRRFSFIFLCYIYFCMKISEGIIFFDVSFWPDIVQVTTYESAYTNVDINKSRNNMCTNLNQIMRASNKKKITRKTKSRFWEKEELYSERYKQEWRWNNFYFIRFCVLHICTLSGFS